MKQQMTKKTRSEIEELKSGWLLDPIWDIEDTEGFEAYHDELLDFRLEIEAEAQRELFDEMETRSTDLKCSYEIARYIINLESRLDKMTERLNSLFYEERIQ